MRQFLVRPAILLTLTLGLLAFYSCETSEGEIDQADLIGTWTFGESIVEIFIGEIPITQFLMTTFMLSKDDAEAMVDQFSGDYGNISGTITFNDDDTYMMKDGDFTESGTYELSEDGKTLSIFPTGEMSSPNTINIKSLTSSSMKLAWDEEEEVDMDDDGEDDTTVTISLEVNLTK